MRSSVLRPLLAGLLLGWLGAAPARAQTPAAANSDGSLSTPAVARPLRLSPLFGGLSLPQATQLLGEDKLKAVAASFASAAEASAFFANKGFEYLSENQPDTATYRFNLAWLLNPNNPDPYRGLGIIASTRATPDAAIALLSKGLALAPTSTLMLSDLGSTYLMRYGLTKKKKDLATSLALLGQATKLDAGNAVGWQQLAQALYYDGKYAEAWDAVHKGQAADLTSLNFGLVSELLAKMPDPQGTIK